MPERLLRVAEVMARTGLSRPTIYRWMPEGRFPKPVALGPSLIAWPESEINEWIADTIRATRGEPAS